MSESAYFPEQQHVLPSGIPHDEAGTHFHSQVGAAVLGPVEKLIFESRKRDLLDGTRLDAEALLRRPYVVDATWQAASERVSSAWQRGCSVVIVVSDRGFGSTTFCQQLLAREQAAKTLVELEAD